MIQIEHDPETSEYHLLEFQSEVSTTYVINPQEVDWDDEINWSAVAPEWAREHGTTVILLGSEEAPDTVLGNPRAGEQDIKGLSVYLNTGFWDLSQTEVAVVELRSERKTSWPLGPDDRDDARRPNRRQIMGAKHYLTDIKAPSGRLSASSVVPLDDGRVIAHRYLWEGERPRDPLICEEAWGISRYATRTKFLSSRVTKRISDGCRYSGDKGPAEPHDRVGAAALRSAAWRAPACM